MIRSPRLRGLSILVLPVLLAAVPGRAEPDPASFPSDPGLLLIPDGEASVMAPAPAPPLPDPPVRRSDAQVLTDPASIDLCDAVVAARRDLSVAAAAGEAPDTERRRSAEALTSRCRAGFVENPGFDCPVTIASLIDKALPDGAMPDQCLYALTGAAPRAFPPTISSPLPSLCARAAVTASGLARPTDPDAAAARITGLTEACLAVTDQADRCGAAITRPLVAAAREGRSSGLLAGYRGCLATFGYGAAAGSRPDGIAE